MPRDPPDYQITPAGEKVLYMGPTKCIPLLSATEGDDECFVVQHVSLGWLEFNIPARHATPPNQERMHLSSVPGPRDETYAEGPAPAWSPMEKQLLAVVTGPRDAIVLFDTETRQHRACLDNPAHVREIKAIAWAPNGRLYSAHACGTVLGPNRRVLLPASDHYCGQIVPHPNRDGVFAGIWLSTYTAQREFRLHRGSQLLFSCTLAARSHETIAYGCEWREWRDWIAFHDGVWLRVWSMKTCMMEATFRLDAGLACLGWAHGGRYLVMGSSTPILLNCPSHVVAWRSHNSAHVIDWSTGCLHKSMPSIQDAVPILLWKAAVSPAGRLAVLFTNGELLLDRNIAAADVAAQPVATFADNAVQAVRAVNHLAEPIRNEDIDYDKEARACAGTRGLVRFGTYRGQPVAVKQCRAEKIPNAAELFHLASSERHEHLIRYLGFFRTTDDLHMVLEWLPGGSTLESFLERVTLDEYQRVHIALKIAHLLQWFHAQERRVHGDIKPDNVVGSAGFFKVKLIDLGCARPVAGHPELDRRIRGRHYPRGVRLTPEMDVAAFRETILGSIWRGREMPFPRSLSEIIAWLEAYRVYILRHMPFPAGVWSDTQPGIMRTLQQRRGTFVWEEVRSLLAGAGAQVLESYYRIKVVAFPPDDTLCIVGSSDPRNGRRAHHVEQLVNAFWWQMPLAGGDRRGLFASEELKLYGPAVTYYDTSTDLGNCSRTAPRVLVDEARFDTICPVLPRRAMLRHCAAAWQGRDPVPVSDDASQEVLPWCLGSD